MKMKGGEGRPGSAEVDIAGAAIFREAREISIFISVGFNVYINKM